MKPQFGDHAHIRLTSDWGVVVKLLERAQLPTEDLSTAKDLSFWLLEDREVPVGVIGLERFDGTALLRSLAVAQTHQRCGLGRSLVTHIEREAYALRINSLALLTQTAERFFYELGYAVAARTSLPEAIQQSGQFRTLCPASAVCMTKVLGNQYE